MAPSAINDAPEAAGRNSPKPSPTKIWSVKEPPFEGVRAVDKEGWSRSNQETAIIIDNGIYSSLGGIRLSTHADVS
jgi:actin-related protein 5